MAILTYKIVKEKGLNKVKHITADMLQGYDEIGMGAFENTKIESIEIPEGVKTICSWVFEDCGRLKSIKGYDKVKKISVGAFYNVSSLRQKIYNENGKLITYKMMHANMTCKFFQYEVGKTYELPSKEKVVVCKTGFHSCYSPFECLNYYFGVYNIDAVMCKCIAESDIDECVTGDKIASRKITILKKFDSYAEAFNDYFAECSKINS